MRKMLAAATTAAALWPALSSAQKSTCFVPLSRNRPLAAALCAGE
jgi:hypothetical protein